MMLQSQAHAAASGQRPAQQHRQDQQPRPPAWRRPLVRVKRLVGVAILMGGTMVLASELFPESAAASPGGASTHLAAGDAR